MSLALIEARESDAPQWDAFVENHPEGRFCQLWGFRQALEETYRYRCVYLGIDSDGERIGVFPSIVAGSPRARLISQPFNEYGGPLVNGSLAPDICGELGKLLLAAARKAGCESIEIRGGTGCRPSERAGYWLKMPRYRYAELPLADPETLWRKSLTHEARKGVKQAQKAGLEVKILQGSDAIQEPFYRLYLDSMKRLGVPPHPRRLFHHLAESLGPRVVAAWAFAQTKPVAALLGITCGRRLQIWITASDANEWSARPNDLAHWELIRWAALQDLRVFDFGSARYAGQIQFKKKWGVAFSECDCYLIARNGSPSSAAIPSVDSSSRSMVVLSRLWRACVPLRLTPVLGAPIRRFLTK